MKSKDEIPLPVENEFRSEAERLGDLLFKSTDGPDPEVSNLTEDEEVELEDLWVSQGYNIILGPYDHPELWVDRINGPRVAASPALQSIGDELPRLPPPPIMTWEDIELGRTGQLSFPVLTTAPIVAERAFLTLAREWLMEVEKAPKDCALPQTADMRALSCLLLAVESGSKFTDVARQQMEINMEAAAARLPPSWIDQLPWKLCQSVFLMSPLQSNAVQELIVNLDHHNSSIRCWMMKIGWFVIPWLNPVEATVRLLKNLADTLSGPFMAAGLAARCFDKEDDFLTFARTFTPLDSFEEQYQNRLKGVEELGIQTVQAPFWETEAICRKEIERAVLGFRIRRMGKHKT